MYCMNSNNSYVFVAITLKITVTIMNHYELFYSLNILNNYTEVPTENLQTNEHSMNKIVKNGLHKL